MLTASKRQGQSYSIARAWRAPAAATGRHTARAEHHLGVHEEVLAADPMVGTTLQLEGFHKLSRRCRFRVLHTYVELVCTFTATGKST